MGNPYYRIIFKSLCIRHERKPYIELYKTFFKTFLSKSSSSDLFNYESTCVRSLLTSNITSVRTGHRWPHCGAYPFPATSPLLFPSALTLLGRAPAGSSFQADTPPPPGQG